MRGSCLSLRDHTCSLKHSFPVLLFAEVTATVVGVMWRAVGRNPGGAWSNPLRYLVKFPAVLGQISCGAWSDFQLPWSNFQRCLVGFPACLVKFPAVLAQISRRCDSEFQLKIGKSDQGRAVSPISPISRGGSGKFPFCLVFPVCP